MAPTAMTNMGSESSLKRRAGVEPAGAEAVFPLTDGEVGATPTGITGSCLAVSVFATGAMSCWVWVALPSDDRETPVLNRAVPADARAQSRNDQRGTFLGRGRLPHTPRLAELRISPGRATPNTEVVICVFSFWLHAHPF